MGDRWETVVGWYCSYWADAVVGSLDRIIDCRTDRIAVVGSLNRRRIDCRTDRTWASIFHKCFKGKEIVAYHMSKKYYTQ